MSRIILRGKHRLTPWRRIKARVRAWWEQGATTADSPGFTYVIPPEAFYPR